MAQVSKHNRAFEDLINSSTSVSNTIYTTPVGERQTMVGMKGNISVAVYDTSSSAGAVRIIIYRSPNGTADQVVDNAANAEPISEPLSNVVWSYTMVLHESDRTSYNVPIDLKTQRKLFSEDKLKMAWVSTSSNLAFSIAYNLNTFILES